ncbi:MAG TPA: PAS domain S-box protein [Roseiflexaceae bacterium]|nr:PAS domain S-box protein [Roseiflexaceae bacterium]
MIVESDTYETLQSEVVALRQRVVELEQALDQSQSALTLAQLQTAIEASIDGIAILDQHGVYRFMNMAHATIHGYERPEELIGQSWTAVVPENLLPWYQQECMPQLYRDGSWRNVVVSKRRDGSLHPTDTALTVLEDGGLVCVVRDVTEQKQIEEDRVRLQNEIIQTQAAMLVELSTPLIPIDNNVMVMPLIGTLDSRRAQQVIDALLAGVAESRTQVAIVDITGVSVVDTQVANALIRAAQSVKLLGAQVVLTGIRPEVAQTLVGLGADLTGLITRSSLQSGIAYAMSLR